MTTIMVIIIAFSIGGFAGMLLHDRYLQARNIRRRRK